MMTRTWVPFTRRLSAVAFCTVLGSVSSLYAAGGGHDADSEHAESHQINWFYGLIGESDDEEPSLLWRPKGMPVPLSAQIINSAVLFYLLYRLGRRGVVEGLKKRRQRIMQGMDDAAKMRKEAASELTRYQERLAQIDAEITETRKQMREAAEAEREQILAEAKRRRERMEREARVLIEQELKAAREALLKETARTAVESARQLLASQANAADHERLNKEHVVAVQSGLSHVQGGQA